RRISSSRSRSDGMSSRASTTAPITTSVGIPSTPGRSSSTSTMSPTSASSHTWSRRRSAPTARRTRSCAPHTTRSPIRKAPMSCPHSRRSSAPDLQSAVQSALTVYVFTTGTQTPLLALLALRRPRNLAAIALSYAALGLVAVILSDPVVAILALSPAPLIGSALARFVGARAETVGALLTGTIVLSFPLLLAAIPGLGQNVNVALFAFVIGATLAGAVPIMRDAILPIVDGARYLALAIILGAAALAALSVMDFRAVG